MMSSLPQLSIAVWTSLPGASPLVRSPAKTAVSPPISDAVCWAASPSRSLITTLAPWALSSSAVARPMPRAEPVTIATLSSRIPIARSYCGYGRSRSAEELDRGVTGGQVDGGGRAASRDRPLDRRGAVERRRRGAAVSWRVGRDPGRPRRRRAGVARVLGSVGVRKRGAAVGTRHLL